MRLLCKIVACISSGATLCSDKLGVCTGSIGCLGSMPRKFKSVLFFSLAPILPDVACRFSGKGSSVESFVPITEDEREEEASDKDADTLFSGLFTARVEESAPCFSNLRHVTEVSLTRREEMGVSKRRKSYNKR